MIFMHNVQDFLIFGFDHVCFYSFKLEFLNWQKLKKVEDD